MGNVVNQHKVYESFKIIPLSLIQNAIKYRKSGDVEIVFDECEDKLDLSVVSYGDPLSEEEISNIFERGYRTEKAKRMQVEGNGLGLYALKVVAEAHKFPVNVKSITHNQGNRPARNIFTVSIH